MRSPSDRPECNAISRPGRRAEKRSRSWGVSPISGHQYQRLAPLPYRRLDGVEIHLGLAAAGDTVQEKRLEAAQGFADGVHRAALFRVELGAFDVVAGRCSGIKDSIQPLSASARLGAAQSTSGSGVSPGPAAARPDSQRSSSACLGARRDRASRSVSRPAAVIRQWGSLRRMRGPSLAQRAGEQGGQHVAQGMVVVAGGPLRERHHVGGDYGLPVQQLERGFHQPRFDPRRVGDTRPGHPPRGVGQRVRGHGFPLPAPDRHSPPAGDSRTSRTAAPARRSADGC